MPMSLDESARLFDQALALQTAGRHEDALPLLDILAARHPDTVEVHRNRATACLALNRLAEALESLERILVLEPDNLDIRVRIGATLQKLGRNDDARRAYDDVLIRRPNDAQLLYNISTLLQHEGRLEDAAAFCRRSLAAQPVQSLANFHLAVILEELARFDEALEFYTRGIAQAEDPLLRADMEWNKGVCLLKNGRLEEGWPLYEARLARAPLPERDKRPVWTGRESLVGKTLLVHAEQGQGDMIQFCRYLPLAAARGGRIIFSCPQRLLALLAPLKPWVELVDEAAPAPAADYQILLMSLPLALATPVLAESAYLAAEPARRAAWALRLGPSGFRIGVCWRCDPHNPEKGRNYPLAALAQIARKPDVRLISLQHGAGLDQLERLPPGMAVENFDDLDAGPDGFLDTAAIMAELDLVITCDTATAHLAGALGRPCWVALPHMPDWRWQLGREESVWYPSLRLFRQATPGAWTPVFAQMAAALQDLRARL